jgi:hypothetical protein
MRERNWPSWSTGTWESLVEIALSRNGFRTTVARCLALSRVVLTSLKSKSACAPRNGGATTNMNTSTSTPLDSGMLLRFQDPVMLALHGITSLAQTCWQWRT